jgi:hypothetical protein
MPYWDAPNNVPQIDQLSEVLRFVGV